LARSPRGLVAGAVGTLAMDVLRFARHRRGGGGEETSQRVRCRRRAREHLLDILNVFLLLFGGRRD
jgi:hypothetical protein